MRDYDGPPTWERIITLARQLELASTRNDVQPEDGARIVRLIVRFDRRISTKRPPSIVPDDENVRGNLTKEARPATLP